jgi:hypothetical protein
MLSVGLSLLLLFHLACRLSAQSPTGISDQTPSRNPIQAPPQTTNQVQPRPQANRSSHLRDNLPTLHARAATGPITIDGKLTEPAWQDAEAVTLTQQSPHPGQPNDYATEVRVVIYNDALIFGFKCHDPDPRKIQVHTLARDGNQNGDDTVSLALDSFGDRRTGYYFQVNEAAGRLDALIAGPGNVSTDWDGIWNARTARTADGWSAEIWIPAQTLTFAANDRHWGVELDRSIVRDQTEMRWASPILDGDLFDMSRAGNLEILAPLKQGHGFELAPYLNGKMLRDFTAPTRNWLTAGGGEVTWRITPQLAAIATVNTDFAETEADLRQINITPFPLYFPEKRAFFLEGANLYEFGLGLSGTFAPFFSRNVGLLDGYDIPLDGGVKLNGHVGPWSLALLDVQTRTTYVPDGVVSTLGLPSAKVNGTNLLASRVAFDPDDHLRVGMILTHGDPEAQLSNTLAGVDAVWHTSTFLKKYAVRLGGWAATTQGDVPLGNRQAWGAHFDFPADLINCYAEIDHFNKGFDPLLGFLPRPATRQEYASCSYRPRPKPDGPFGAIRQGLYLLGYSRVTDTDGNLQSQEISVSPFGFTLNSGAMVTVSAFVRHETLTSPFAVVPTVTIPAVSYDFQRYDVFASSSPQKPITFTNNTTFGGYYDGHLFHQTNTLKWTPLHGRVELGVTADNFFAHTPQGNFVEKLWQFNGALAWSPDLSVSTLVQYDNVSFDLSSNTRFRWTFRPGNDFFIIWDRTWVRNIEHPGLNLDPDAESLQAKIRWTFRL